MRFHTRALLFATAIGMASNADAATYQLLQIPDAPIYGGTASVSDISINNKGTLAYHKVTRPGGGSASSNVGGIQYQTRLGERQFVQTGSGFDALFEGRFPVINDAGDTLAYFSGPTVNGFPTVQWVVLGADGSSRVVANVAPNSGGVPVPGAPTFASMSVAFNSNGDVAALVTTLDGKQQIVRLDANGSPPSVIAEASNSLFTLGIPDINDAGEVVFIATKPSNPNAGLTTTVSVYKSDGTTLDEVIELPSGPFPAGIPSINNEGDIFVGASQPGTGGSATILLQSGSSTPVVTQLDPAAGSSVQAASINDYGQQAYLLDNQLYIDGELVVGAGTVIDGLGTVAPFPGASGPVGMLPGVSFNNLGQAIAGVFTSPDLSGAPNNIETSRILVALDGSTLENPILPSETVAGVTKVSYELINALGFEEGSPIYVDPIFGEGLTYTITNGGPNFTSLTVPTQDLGGLSIFEVSFGGLLETLNFGETLDFNAFIAGGVASFSIFGKDDATSYSGDFVAGFTHASLGTVEIDITGASRNVAAVPLPATALLLLLGLGLLAGVQQRRRSS